MPGIEGRTAVEETVPRFSSVSVPQVCVLCGTGISSEVKDDSSSCEFSLNLREISKNLTKNKAKLIKPDMIWKVAR